MLSDRGIKVRIDGLGVREFAGSRLIFATFIADEGKMVPRREGGRDKSGLSECPHRVNRCRPVAAGSSTDVRCAPQNDQATSLPNDAKGHKHSILREE
jgi:hypothetical protein